VHISEGVLSAPVLIAGVGVAAAGVGIGLRRLDDDRIPVVAVLAAAFFVASLIHVPIGVGNAHLILNGLAGVILGWAAFPALLVGLLLHAILFGYGGLTVLGVNTVVMALPGVACHYLLRGAILRGRRRTTFAMGFIAGAMSVAMAGALLAAALLASGREFLRPMQLMLIAHVPIMLIEGLVTGWVVVFLVKVRPEVFGATATTTIDGDEE